MWEKGEKHMLTDHFSTEEFNCHCTSRLCKEQKISIDLVEKIQAIRDALKIPVWIVSAYRCKVHQAALEKNKQFETAKGVSQHCLGNAADITCSAMSVMKDDLPKHFKAIGYAKGFFHVDLRDDKLRRWTYSY